MILEEGATIANPIILCLYFGTMTLFVFVRVVTNSVRHTGDFITQAFNGIEIVGAGIKSGSLTS
jgi:hypothetical protein